jgi:hypothetical protein
MDYLAKLGELPEALKVDVHGCARCGEDHKDMDFRAFRSPIFDSDGSVWTHWAICPNFDEPVLLKQVTS